MPVYTWVAETKKGRKLKGELEAADEKIAQNQLKRRNLEVKKIKELWGNGGGIILAPSHEILPDTPINNVLALYEEINEN